MVDRELCVQAADRALAYLRERVLDDTWVAAHRDIAYYFKAPQAFLLAGLRDEAAAAFDALEPFLDEGGAASGSAAYRLAYPHYPYMWAAKAARELGRTAAIINDLSCTHFVEVAAACDAKLGEWRLEKAHGDRDGSGFGVVGGDADFFATATRRARFRNICSRSSARTADSPTTPARWTRSIKRPSSRAGSACYPSSPPRRGPSRGRWPDSRLTQR